MTNRLPKVRNTFKIIPAVFLAAIAISSAAIIVFNSLSPKTITPQAETKGIETSVPILVAITYPTWGTIVTWKEKTRADAIVEHTYPLTKVVFQISTGPNSSKNVCTLTQEPFTCTYIVPYTGNGRGGGGTAGYGLSVYAYDVAGNVGVDVLQMWSHK